MVQDNNKEKDFSTTYCTNIAINILQDLTSDTVSGHVIFKQVGSFIVQKYKDINDTNCQKYIVQSLCTTVPGRASQLLQPKALLFP